MKKVLHCSLNKPPHPIRSELCQVFAVLWVHGRDSVLLAIAAAYKVFSSVCPAQLLAENIYKAVLLFAVNELY